MTANVVPMRRPAGTREGGRFAPTGHAETAVSLVPTAGSTGHAGAPADGLPSSPDRVFAAPTGSMTGVDPKARAALLDETAPTVSDPDGRYPVTIGPKYDRDRWRSAAEVARLLRADLKAAQESAALPPSAVFSVRSESFAGGQSVRVEIRNLPDREILDDHPDYPNRLNRDARELERTVRRMANAYNRDASDSQSDVFDVHYYAQVSIETEASRQSRQYLAAEEEIQACWRRGVGRAPCPRCAGVLRRHDGRRSAARPTDRAGSRAPSHGRRSGSGDLGYRDRKRCSTMVMPLMCRRICGEVTAITDGGTSFIGAVLPPSVSSRLVLMHLSAPSVMHMIIHWPNPSTACTRPS